MSIPITNGTGESSVAAEAVSGLQYQRVQVLSAGGSSIWGISSDGSAKVSVIGNPTVFIAGSVAAVTASTSNQSVSGTVGASIIGTAPVDIKAGSVIAIPQGSLIAAGTYAEDTASNSGDRGFFNLLLRNDTLASVTSNDGDYSGWASGPSGEGITVNAPFTKWVSGTADFRTNAGASIAVIAPQGASIFTYVTGVQVTNLSQSSVLVTLSGATSSIVGYTIGPAGGGSNIYYQNGLKTRQNAAFSASISAVASVLVSAQGFISKS